MLHWYIISVCVCECVLYICILNFGFAWILRIANNVSSIHFISQNGIPFWLKDQDPDPSKIKFWKFSVVVSHRSIIDFRRNGWLTFWLRTFGFDWCPFGRCWQLCPSCGRCGNSPTCGWSRWDGHFGRLCGPSVKDPRGPCPRVGGDGEWSPHPLAPGPWPWHLPRRLLHRHFLVLLQRPWHLPAAWWALPHPWMQFLNLQQRPSPKGQLLHALISRLRRQCPWRKMVLPMWSRPS